MQHVMCHMVWRDSSAVRFDRVEITFILALFYWLYHQPMKLSTSKTCAAMAASTVTVILMALLTTHSMAAAHSSQLCWFSHAAFHTVLQANIILTCCISQSVTSQHYSHMLHFTQCYKPTLFSHAAFHTVLQANIILTCCISQCYKPTWFSHAAFHSVTNQHYVQGVSCTAG